MSGHKGKKRGKAQGSFKHYFDQVHCLPREQEKRQKPTGFVYVRWDFQIERNARLEPEVRALENLVLAERDRCLGTST